MNMLKLVVPAPEHEQAAKEYIQEFINYGSKIHGVGGLDRCLGDYAAWLQYTKNNTDKKTVETGKVTGDTYFSVRISDNRIVGMINIRHELNDFLLREGGHIGYGIRPTERKKGYANEQLKLGLNRCRELSINKVLITADKDNIASVKTILKNGGVLENEIITETEVLQRYWIDLG